MSDFPDAYAKGMSAWAEEDDRVLDTYRVWQLGLIKPYLGRRILEVGPGNGRMATLLSREHSYDIYVAAEPSGHFFRGLVEVAETLTNFEPRNCVVDDVPESDFDTVFSVHVMEHVEDDLAFIRESYARLKPGGYLITLVPALGFLYSALDRKIGHYRRYNRSMIRPLANCVGADVVLNRYDNLIGVLGWMWVCKIRGIDYHSDSNKKALVGYFKFFSQYVLPIASRIEKTIAPPLGLNLTCVLQKPRHEGRRASDT